MKGFRPWHRGFCMVLLAVVAPLSLVAQEPSEAPETGSFGSAVGWLDVDGRESPLPYTLTAAGVLVALQPVVDRLGGELIIGPLQQGHTLRLFADEDEVLFGPDSEVITVGEKIVPLSRTPLAGLGGTLEVPLDLLEKTYGDLLGYDFRWSWSDRTLRVHRLPRRELSVTVDLVQISDTSTLVLQFPDRLRYRVVEVASGLEIAVLGDSLELRGRLPRPDSLVRNVEVLRDRVRVGLSEDAEAAAPYLLRRGRRTQLVLDVSRRRTALRRRPPTPGGSSSTWQGMKIVVDPGHGGVETGAVGPQGTLEKELTFQLASGLKRRLESRLPVRVILTRNADLSLDHASRTAIANQNQADLFLSLHLNSEPGRGTARGAETFFLDSQASDESAAASAAFENQGQTASSDGTNGGDDLQLMLWDLAQSRHLSESQRLAKLVQEELNQTLGIRDRGVKQAPFAVLMGATMPAILVELGFLSNGEEEEKLLDPAYRLQLVDALVRAVTRYRAGLRERSLAAAAEDPGERRGRRP